LQAQNVFTIITHNNINDASASLTYRMNIYVRKDNSVYYNEPYRDQYHYSVKDGWANDPNGLVYYNGKYHMFYQYYTDTVWGPMHWAHATSTDLIHWEEQPISLYPDENGTMFSGCIVVDENNTSGFFNETGSGLIAFITCDGNGQRIKLAYSTDEGITWTKVDKIAADWTNDPLQDGAFRDPKVFKYNGKWFMVVAGGPLRIYSSENLVDWKCDSTYADLHTECPDLYPIEVDGTVKWVLSRGGRYYKVGDFKEVDGNYTFVPDEAYVNKDGVMNFGKDSYAAMTYYVQDFGYEGEMTIPDIVELNWMNTWEDGICNLVGSTLNQSFNGTFNLNLKLGLINDNGTYVLTQMPVDAYNTLKGQAVTLKDETINGKKKLDFTGDSYLIEATFKPEEGVTKVGFNVRVGQEEKTVVSYDLNTSELSIDRSQSGVIINEGFARVDKQSNVSRNADGSITLHIYVDRASVEVFNGDYTATGANQIFPSLTSLDVEAFSEGGQSILNADIYPMGTLWDKETPTNPISIGSSSKSETNIYVGETTTLSAYVVPLEVSQQITWEVEGDVVSLDKTSGTEVTVSANKKGTAKVKAIASVDNSIYKEFTIKVNENNFNTNVEASSVAGNWHVEDEYLIVSNNGSNDYYMSNTKHKGAYTTSFTINYEKGLVNIFVSSKERNPHNTDSTKGAYSIQLTNDTEVRLFEFGKDNYTTAQLEKSINDGQDHDIVIEKTLNSIKVTVDGTDVLNYTFDTVDDFFNEGYVGLGLWDGSIQIQDYLVNCDHSTEIRNKKEPTFFETGYTGDEYCTVCNELIKKGVDIPKLTAEKGWLQKGEDWYYFTSDTEFVKSDWLQLGSTWYYFDEKGIMVTGVYTVKDVIYYFDASGALANGWRQEENDWYYATTNGVYTSRWLQSGTTWYYFDEKGIMATGLYTVKDVIYYFDASGALANGWRQEENDWYYATTNGIYTSRWLQSGTTWYYFDEKGIMVCGEQTINGNKYLFDEDGKMMTGWKELDGAWYYFTENGAIQSDWLLTSGKWYYFNSEGKMVTGFKEIGNKTYYFNESGDMMDAGWKKIEGNWYYINTNGNLYKGWLQLGSTWYYLDPENNGQMVTGVYTVKDVIYFFDPSGALATGWRQDGEDWYYSTIDGVYTSRWFKSGSDWYYLDEKGIMVTGSKEIDGKEWHFDENGKWLPDK
ncbi:MAG: GH32 C-terminal domain-containing protein, partial [Holdemanella sp.]|nr:GH32 C-terminal domain-containing protein [Holdemanella sp.]